MRTSRYLSAIVGLLMTAACAHAASPSPERPWHMTATVVSVSDDSMQVRHKSGRRFSVALDTETRYFVKQKPDSRLSLHEGSRVVLELDRAAGADLHARRVQLFP